MDEILVVHTDLTRLEGTPTNRATPLIGRVPDDPYAGGASAALVLAALAAMAFAVGVGIWLGRARR